MISPHLSALPDGNFYRVKLSCRGLHEVIASQIRVLERRGEPNPLAEDEELDLYEKHFVKIRGLVKRQRNVEMLEVDHHETLADPAAWATRINDFLGGRLDVQEMAPVGYPRLYRNRKEMLSRSDLGTPASGSMSRSAAQ